MQNWLDAWDTRIAQYLDGKTAMNLQVLHNTAVLVQPFLDALPEPYVGNPLAPNLLCVFLGLNPGGPDPGQQLPNGKYVLAAQRHGYSSIATNWASMPPGTVAWWRARSRWISRVLGIDGGGQPFCLDMVPWRSKGFGGLADNAANALIQNLVLVPAFSVAPGTAASKALKYPIVFCFGKPWSQVLTQAGFAVVAEASHAALPPGIAWPLRADNQPTQRQFKLYMMGHGDAARFVLQTYAPGTNHAPAVHFDNVVRWVLAHGAPVGPPA